MARFMIVLFALACVTFAVDSDTDKERILHKYPVAVPIPAPIPVPAPVPIPLPVPVPAPVPVRVGSLSNLLGSWRSSIPGRPGLCPFVNRLVPQTAGPVSASVCGNLCRHDFQCSRGRKCCPTDCGYSCFEAVYLPKF